MTQGSIEISGRPPFFRQEFRAMGGANEVQMFAADSALAISAASAAIAEVRRVEQKFSRYLPDSVISRINDAAGRDAVDIDDETSFLLAHAAACHQLSDGLFDITSGVLRRIWDFASGRPPEQNALQACLTLVGWDRVERDDRRVRLPVEGMQLDFGGLGKEYAVDRACSVLRQLGITSALVNLGGDVRILGPRPDGSGWPVHIVHPRRQGELVASIKLTQGALATSGDYQRFFDFEGQRYCHVLNPFTGQPAGCWQSVSVLSALSLDAGSIATTGMLLGQSAPAFMQQRRENALLIDQSGDMTGSGLLARFAAPEPPATNG